MKIELSDKQKKNLVESWYSSLSDARKMILDVISKERWLSAIQLLEICKEKGMTMSKPAFYDNVHELTKQGILRTDLINNSDGKILIVYWVER
jgi:Fe2+ or Zn2+ uptake regulation protein